MKMVGHYNPCVQIQSLIFLAKSKAIQKDIPVNIPGKNIYPIYYCGSYKIDTLLIIEFVFTTHRINIQRILIYAKLAGMVVVVEIGNDQSDW